MHTTYKYTTHCFTCRRLIHILIRIIPVASFLCPLKTCSSSLRLRMSKSLHKWSRDAVNSQLPLRFHFTSMTVFLCACLRTKRNKTQNELPFLISLSRLSTQTQTKISNATTFLSKGLPHLLTNHLSMGNKDYNIFVFYRRLLTYSVAKLCPVFGSQNLIGCWLSLLPDTTKPFVGCQSTHFTSAP